jgi:hypothetical protein
VELGIGENLALWDFTTTRHGGVAPLFVGAVDDRSALLRALGAVLGA